MDGWNTSFLFGWSIFRGKLLLLGRVPAMNISTWHLKMEVWKTKKFPFGGKVLGHVSFLGGFHHPYIKKELLETLPPGTIISRISSPAQQEFFK